MSVKGRGAFFCQLYLHIRQPQSFQGQGRHADVPGKPGQAIKISMHATSVSVTSQSAISSGSFLQVTVFHGATLASAFPSSGKLCLPVGASSRPPSEYLLQMQMGSEGLLVFCSWGTPGYPIVTLAPMHQGKWTRCLFSCNSVLLFLSERMSSGMCHTLSHS